MLVAIFRNSEATPEASSFHSGGPRTTLSSIRASGKTAGWSFASHMSCLRRTACSRSWRARDTSPALPMARDDATLRRAQMRSVTGVLASRSLARSRRSSSSSGHSSSSSFAARMAWRARSRSAAASFVCSEVLRSAMAASSTATGWDSPSTMDRSDDTGPSVSGGDPANDSLRRLRTNSTHVSNHAGASDSLAGRAYRDRSMKCARNRQKPTFWPWSPPYGSRSL